MTSPKRLTSIPFKGNLVFTHLSRAIVIIYLELDRQRQISQDDRQRQISQELLDQSSNDGKYFVAPIAFRSSLIS